MTPADDGGHALWCGDQHSRTWCCQRGARIDWEERADSLRIRLCLSARRGRHHRGDGRREVSVQGELPEGGGTVGETRAGERQREAPPHAPAGVQLIPFGANADGNPPVPEPRLRLLAHPAQRSCEHPERRHYLRTGRPDIRGVCGSRRRGDCCLHRSADRGGMGEARHAAGEPPHPRHETLCQRKDTWRTALLGSLWRQRHPHHPPRNGSFCEQQPEPADWRPHHGGRSGGCREPRV